MSQFYDQASLVMVPSGYKDGKLYSQKPLSTSGELTFSRGSDIEATRIGADGYIHKAQVNLLLQSNTFSTTWVNVATTETGGQADKDGGTSAWKLEASSGGSSRVIGQTNALTGVCTFSVYAKAGNISYLALENGTQFTYASLVDGTQGNNSGLIDYAATSVGNGWWRISIAFNKAASSDLRIYLASSNTSSVVSGGDYIYIQDAQLNYGLVAQTYQETTTAAVVSGITNDMPRLNYDPANPTCPHLILEPARSNAIAFSELFSGSGWTAIRVAITANATTSPEGVQNATKLNGSTDNNTHSIYYNATTATSGQGQSFSIYAKAAELSYISIYFSSANGTFGGDDLVVNLSNGTVDSVDADITASIEDAGNGWYRIKATRTALASAVGIVAIRLHNGTSESFAGSASEGIYIYGAQQEINASYVSSYIPTYGSSATRTADACSKTGISSLIGQTEGTIYAEVDFDSNVNTEGYIFRIDETSFNDTVFISRGDDKRLNAILTSGGSAIVQLQQNNFNGLNKVAFAYKSGNFALYVNGTQVAVSSATYTNGITYDDIRLGGYSASAANMAGGIYQALLFKTRLSNADLATLTSL